MPYLLSHGTVKPPLGVAQVNWAHPFVRKLLFGAWFNHPGVGARSLGTDLENIIPTWGSVAPRTVLSNHTSNTLQSNLEGPCVRFGVLNENVNFGPDPIPAAQVTICIVRKKNDATNRNPGYTFSLSSFSTLATTCSCNMPFSDGTTYWNFGGQTAGTTRLTIAGLTYSTIVPERWVFVAGSRGMAIWRNGRKLASQATANPGRTIDTAQVFRLNWPGAGGGGDVQDINFFMAIDDQWNDALCQWWSAEPYAHLYPPLRRRVLAGVAGAAGAAARTQVTMLPW